MIAPMVVCTASVRESGLSDGSGVAEEDGMYISRMPEENLYLVVGVIDGR